MHIWSDWQESILNRYAGHHCKTATRYCNRCGKSEQSIISFDCTKQKRTGEWCENCFGHEGFAEYTKQGYIVNMPRTGRPVGRPLEVKKRNRAKKLREAGLSFDAIAKKMKANKTSVFRWINFPEEKAKKYY